MFYRATDADQGTNAAIRYAIIGGNTQSQFSIDSLSGDVSLVKPLDYETIRSYRLVIRAQGIYLIISNVISIKFHRFTNISDGGSPSRSNTTQVLINVKDINDNTPRFYTSLFQESVSESVPVGYSIVRVSNLTFSIITIKLFKDNKLSRIISSSFLHFESKSMKKTRHFCLNGVVVMGQKQIFFKNIKRGPKYCSDFSGQI